MVAPIRIEIKGIIRLSALKLSRTPSARVTRPMGYIFFSKSPSCRPTSTLVAKPTTSTPTELIIVPMPGNIIT